LKEVFWASYSSCFPLLLPSQRCGCIEGKSFRSSSNCGWDQYYTVCL